MHPNEERFPEHIRTRKAKPPSVLYKYCSLDRALSIALSGHVLWNSPRLYNDPFDCQWNPMWQVTTPEACEEAAALFRRSVADPAVKSSEAPTHHGDNFNTLHQSLSGLDPGRREKEIEQCVEGLRRQHSDGVAAMRETFSDQVRRMRVFCLTEDPLSILMWSHYGDEHRGVALGFVTSALENEWQVPAERVQYAEDLPVMVNAEAWREHQILGSNRSYLVAEPKIRVLTKHSGWQYEKEWRFVDTVDGDATIDRDFFKLPRVSLARVVFGCRVDPAKATELLSLIGPILNSNSVVKLKCHPTRFELVEEPFDSPVIHSGVEKKG